MNEQEFLINLFTKVAREAPPVWEAIKCLPYIAFGSFIFFGIPVAFFGKSYSELKEDRDNCHGR